jgi:primase-polymerase (primpol)-like protein
METNKNPDSAATEPGSQHANAGFDYTAIPTELQTRPQWVGWLLVTRDGKPTKVPINPHTGCPGSTTDSTTWGTLEEAVAATSRFKLNGIGFVFTADDPYVGIDLDKCLRNGDPNVWARNILKRIKSYTEISPSGLGLHIICKGTIPAGRKKGHLEIYASGRYFTMTGRLFPGAPTTIHARQELEAVYAEHFGTPEAEARAQHEQNIREGAPPKVETRNGAGADTIVRDPHLTDDAILERARQAANAGKFMSLWAGDTSGYPSHSEADAALCAMLAFWSQGDAAQIDRLFRRSGLYREKWDARHFGDGKTYGEMTIARAIAHCGPTYSGNGGDRKSTDGHPSVDPNSDLATIVRRELTAILGKAGTGAGTSTSTEPTSDEDPLVTLATMLSLPPILCVHKRGAREPSWELELVDGRHIILGDGYSVMAFNRVRACVFDTTGLVLPDHNRKQWQAVVALIGRIAVETEGISQEQETQFFIREFQRFSTQILEPIEGPNLKCLRDLLFVNGWMVLANDQIALRAPGVHAYLTQHCHLKWSYRELGLRLGRIGFKSDRLQTREGKETITVRIWLSPLGWGSADNQ